MGTFSATVRTAMLDAVGNAAAYSEAAIYAQLHTGDPGAAGTSNVATETTRKQVSFGAASNGAISNDAAVEWTDVSTTETYTHISLWDAEESGNFVGSDDLSSSAAMTAGDTFRIPIGDLDMTIT